MPRPLSQGGGLKPPTKTTLRKYRLGESDWWLIVHRQKFLCPVCSQKLAGRKLAIDHAHVPRFKKMRPEERRRHVRGVLHSFCNRYVRGWLTLVRAAAILAYLQAHEKRRESWTTSDTSPRCSPAARRSPG